MESLLQISLGIALGIVGSFLGVLVYFGRPLSRREQALRAAEENARPLDGDF
jgi:hypothetical protein